jgi:KaiC/GvpD/RAD55 family RecA-like ATPase
MNPNYKYCEIVEGGVTNRGNFVEIEDCHALDYYTSITPMIDCFHSLFMQSNKILNHSDGRGGKTGYNGSVWSDYLFWDVDCGDLEKARLDTITLITRLVEIYKVEKNSIRVFFSGCKGFHVLVQFPELENAEYKDRADINDVIKKVCMYIGNGIDSVDSHIYDKTRIVRTTNTINSKTGLYKIPVDIFEEDIELILSVAKNKRHFIGYINRLGTSLILSNLLIEMIKTPNKTSSSRKFSQEEILNGIETGFAEGERNTGLLSVAGLLRSRSFEPNIIYAFLSAINRNSDNPLEDTELWSIARSVLRYNPDPLFLEPSASDIHTIEDAANSWLKLRERTNKLSSGFNHLDKELPYFDPGEVLMIAARSGVGKTSWGMQLSNGIAKGFGGYGLFASLEMPETSVFIRSVVMEMSKRSGEKKTYEEVVNNVLQDKSIINSVIESWKNLLLIDKTSLSIDQIRRYYEIANEKVGFKINNVLVDYIGLINGTDDYSGLSKVARGLKTLAKQCNTRVICIVQLSRKAGDGTIPITMDMLRDSGAIEESADYIAGMYLSNKDPSIINCSMLKNRFGERGKKFAIKNTGLHYTTIDAED